MKAISLFSGIGGLDLAAGWAGIETVLFCEKDPYCQKVLSKHWPDVPIVEDIRDVRGFPVDIVFGGFPCQPFSVAGNRKGNADDRYLWPEMLRVIRESNPTWVVGENVKGLVTLGLDTICDDLEKLGYTVQTYCIPACAIGAVHRRERLFILAHSASNGRNEGKTAGGNVSANDARRQKGTEENSQHEGCSSIRTILDRRTVEVGTWGVEPPPLRVDDGFPARMDRNRVLGNAVVPQQAYPIFNAIAKISNGERVL